MRFLRVILVSAGLASAAVVDTAEKRDPNRSGSGFGNSFGSGFNQLEAEIEELQLSGFDSSLYNLGNLQNLNIGGLSLGSFDLSNSNDLESILLQLGGGLCLGNVFSQSSLESLSLVEELEMLQMMAQLYELLQLGFLNLSEVQSLFLGGFNQFGSNSLNLGILRRSRDELVKVSRRFSNLAPR
jgi:hypothetical protein